MIDLNKKYRLRDGREVVLSVTDEKYVYGHFKDQNSEWVSAHWDINNGRFYTKEESSLDLVEAKPRIKHTVWMNVYKNFISSHPTKEFADFHDNSCGRADFYDRGGSRFACVKIELDVQEGEGL